jgi:phage host-nuclease inhibitor protein Gam
MASILIKPLAWHEECLSNFQQSLAGKKRQLEQLSAEVRRMQTEATDRKKRIEEARRKGVTELSA